MEHLNNLGPYFGPKDEAAYYNELYNSYAWHFRIKDRPATWHELIKFAQWHGFKDKEPTKRKLVDHFLNCNINF